MPHHMVRSRVHRGKHQGFVTRQMEREKLQTRNLILVSAEGMGKAIVSGLRIGWFQALRPRDNLLLSDTWPWGD